MFVGEWKYLQQQLTRLINLNFNTINSPSAISELVYKNTGFQSKESTNSNHDANIAQITSRSMDGNFQQVVKT